MKAFQHEVKIPLTEEIKFAAGEPRQDGWGVFENYESGMSPITHTTLRDVFEEREDADNRADSLNTTEGVTEYDTSTDPDSSMIEKRVWFDVGGVTLKRSEVQLIRVDSYEATEAEN